jgi:hypothetical protein
MEAGEKILHAHGRIVGDAEHRFGAIGPGQDVGGKIKVPGSDFRRLGGEPQGPLAQFDAKVGVQQHGRAQGPGHHLSVTVCHVCGQRPLYVDLSGLVSANSLQTPGSSAFGTSVVTLIYRRP